MKKQGGNLSPKEAAMLAVEMGIIDSDRIVLMAQYDAICLKRRQDRPAVVTFQLKTLLKDIPAFIPNKLRKRGSMADMPRLPELQETDGVYVGRDGAGTVLYVGYSMNLQQRIHQHVKRPSHKSHYGLVVRANLPGSLAWAVDFYPMPDQVSGLALEDQLICDFKPMLNAETPPTVESERLLSLSAWKELKPKIEKFSGHLQFALPSNDFIRGVDDELERGD